MSEVEIRIETEEIEVTLSGLFPPYKADYMRKFIPGLTTVYVTISGVGLPPMSPEQFKAWASVLPGPLVL